MLTRLGPFRRVCVRDYVGATTVSPLKIPSILTISLRTRRRGGLIESGASWAMCISIVVVGQPRRDSSRSPGLAQTQTQDRVQRALPLYCWVGTYDEIFKHVTDREG